MSLSEVHGAVPSQQRRSWLGFEAANNWASILFNQFSQIGKGRRQLQQQDLLYLTSWALAIFPMLALLYILHFYFNDQAKVPRDLYVVYRFGMAGVCGLLGIVAYLGRERRLVVQASYLTLATLLSVVQAWSMTLGPKVTIKWVMWLPTFVLVLTSNSFLFSATWLALLVYVTRPFWMGRDFDRALFSDFTFALFALLFSQIIRRIWYTSQINYILYEEARAALEEEERTFYNQIKRFISPVLVDRIEAKKRNGFPAIAALDEVLKRRRKIAATIFSDIRNFSERADETHFIEQELIPSAASIIDPAERNLGVAKQIGDAVLVYYDLEDPEESLLRALRDAVQFSNDEAYRIANLKRDKIERYFSIAFGEATVGNMASDNHREATIIGYPANLAARLDALTKDEGVLEVMKTARVPCVLLSASAAELIRQFGKDFDLVRLDLKAMGLGIRSFPGESYVCLFPSTSENNALLSRLLGINNLAPLSLRPGPGETYG